jgi:hypothetical protein
MYRHGYCSDEHKNIGIVVYDRYLLLCAVAVDPASKSIRVQRHLCALDGLIHFREFWSPRVIIGSAVSVLSTRNCAAAALPRSEACLTD